MIRVPASLLNFFLLALMTSTSFATEDEERQLCGEADQHHLFRENHDFAEALKSCSGLSGLDVECFGNTYRGISEDSRSVSAGCTNCYSRMTSCTINNCSWKCMWDPKGIKCRDCAHAACGDSLEKCTGKKRSESPDFKRART